jgi:hypothetical protein
MGTENQRRIHNSTHDSQQRLRARSCAAAVPQALLITQITMTNTATGTDPSQNYLSSGVLLQDVQ